MNMTQEEDESCWVPLTEEETSLYSLQQAQAPPNSALPPPPDSTPAPTSSAPPRESLQVISARLDSKIRLKQGLVDHPFDRAWRLFLQHFCREIWQLEIHLRLGIVLVVFGAMLLLVKFALSFQWFHPQTIILLVVFGVSFYYLAPPDVEQKFHAFFRLLLNPDKAFEFADYADPAIMRRLFVVLLLTPTFLETRTFGFLSEAMAEAGFVSNVSVGILLAAFLTYRFKIQKATPRQCIQQGIYVLYGFAFFFSVWRVDLRRLPALAGPFFLATGTLLLSSRDEDMNWLSRALRHALRLTLRDVLGSVGESVREDEMLQLAMLRWLVDYWSYQPSPAPTPPTPASSSPNSSAASGRSESRIQSEIVPSRVTQPQETQQPHDLQWEELQPMLDMTTDQMIEEVPTHRAGSFSEQPYSESLASHQSSTVPSRQRENDSLRNLRNMLHTLDIDDRARPAVMKYKNVVESFPPSRNHAVIFSILRRCPAMLMLLYLYISGSDLALASTATLLPFAIMEAFRVLHWAEACQRALDSLTAVTATSEQVPERQSRSSLISLPPNMDPMCILLSGDFYSPTFPPPLLQVWINICSSVHALETGLTAARCVQTTAVAADFASNMISLVHFGFEVTQYGWLHGITVLAKEIMHIHATQSAAEAKYTSAAFNAVRNGSIVARNVKALSEEDEGNLVIDPIVGVLTAIVGRGWLWGREDEQNPPESTVTIEELPPDEAPQDQGEPEFLIQDAPSAPKGDEEDGSIELSEDAAQKPLAEEILVKSEDSKGVMVDACSKSEAAADQVENIAPTADDEQKPASSDAFPPASKAVTSGNEESEHDLSELMELIADAFEQDLIAKSEKNAFMETLTQEKPSNATIEQMERSLRELLESSRIAVTSGDDNQNESEPPVLSPEEGDAGEVVTDRAVMDTSVMEHVDDSDEWKPLSAQPQETTELQMDGSKSLNEASSAVSLQTSAVAPQPSETLIGTPDLQSNAVTARNSGGQQEDKGDEWVKWLGGSIAVIGAVAGGIAIANNASNRDDDRSSHQNSTVHIEELDDNNDENADEWVAVSQHNNGV